jgi:hypothetical protein
MFHHLGNPLPAQLPDDAEQETRRDLPHRRHKSAEPYAAANDLRLRLGFLAQYDEPVEALGQFPRGPLRERATSHEKNDVTAPLGD